MKFSRVRGICTLLAAVMLLAAGTAEGADTAVEEEALSTAQSQPVRRALIICGHPGDDEHRAQFAETIEQLQQALSDAYGFESENIWVLFGGEEPAPADPGLESPRGPSTQESLQATAAELRDAILPDDVLWVIAMGHAHYDGRHSWFNLPGPDLHEEQFAALFQDVACREQVYWITIPASGYYLQPLSGEGRIIISATEADRELNETQFPHVLATVLAADVEADSEGGTKPRTLLELYLAVTRSVAEQFVADMQVPTEHALLEGNGDGRGTEIQFEYLPEELGGRLQDSAPPEPLPNSDAAAAAAIVLPQRESPPPDDGNPAPAEAPGDASPAEPAEEDEPAADEASA